MSIKGDFGFEPVNQVSLTGQVRQISALTTAAFGGELISFLLHVPRLTGGADQIMCFALNGAAEEIEEHISLGDVVHVEGRIYVKRSVTVRVETWWIEDGDIPSDPAAREEALKRAERELDRQRMSIGTLLPPADMDGRESAAWTLAMMYGAEWERRWAEHGNGEAASDTSIARVYGILRDAKFPPRVNFSGDEEIAAKLDGLETAARGEGG